MLLGEVLVYNESVFMLDQHGYPSSDAGVCTCTGCKLKCLGDLQNRTRKAPTLGDVVGAVEISLVLV